jgi:hypothetical protein
VSVAAAAGSGDRLAALTALRDRLAVEIDDCSSKRDMAALSLRFMDVVEQIEELSRGGKPSSGGEPKETGLSEFERRLAERESKAPRRRAGSGA